MYNTGSSILADDNQRICPRCFRETGNEDLCSVCIQDDENEGFEVGEVNEL